MNYCKECGTLQHTSAASDSEIFYYYYRGEYMTPSLFIDEIMRQVKANIRKRRNINHASQE